MVKVSTLSFSCCWTIIICLLVCLSVLSSVSAKKESFSQALRIKEEIKNISDVNRLLEEVTIDEANSSEKEKEVKEEGIDITSSYAATTNVNFHKEKIGYDQEETRKEKALKEDEIESIIRHVKEMEHAKDVEREQENQYLGDDDEANEGDLEQKLQHLPNEAMRKRLEGLIFAAKEEERKRLATTNWDLSLILPDFEKIKEQIKEKSLEDGDGKGYNDKKVKKLIDKMDANQWKLIEENLEKDNAFAVKLMDKKNKRKVSAIEEHKRLMIQRRESKLRDRGEDYEVSMTNLKREMKDRGHSWKDKFSWKKQNKRKKRKLAFPLLENLEHRRPRTN